MKMKRSVPLVFSWDSPVWWDFLPGLQELQEPSFLHRLKYKPTRWEIFEQACKSSPLTALEEDFSKHLVVTCALFLTTFIVLIVCIVRWRRQCKAHNVAFPTCTAAICGGDGGRSWGTMSEQKEDVFEDASCIAPSTHPDAVTPMRLSECGSARGDTDTGEQEQWGPKNLLDMLNGESATMSDTASLISKHSPMPKRREEKELEVGKGSRCYLRNFNLFVAICNLIESIYTLPCRLFRGSSLKEGAESESRPRYVQAWYAVDSEVSFRSPQ